MAVSLKHAFSSGKADGVDATLVQPSNWNSEHNLTVSSTSVLGRLGYIWPSAINITAITKANPGVFTSTGASFLLSGQLVTISGVGGMTELNGKTYVYTPLSGTTFRLAELATPTVPLNTTSYGTYTSGGTATPTGAALAVELSVTGGAFETDKVVLDTSPTINTPTLTNPTVTNYTETRFAATISSSPIVLALTDGTFQSITTKVGSNSITLPSPSSGKSLTVQVIYASTPTSLAFTSPSGTLRWPGGTPPTATLTNAKVDIYAFISDGTDWYGIQSGANF